MANKIIRVPSNFNMKVLGDKIFKYYKKEGYSVDIYGDSTNLEIKLSKDMKGFLRWLGLAKQLTVNIYYEDDTLELSFSDKELVGKIVAIAVGWYIIFIQLITGLIGLFGQLSMPKDVTETIRKLSRKSVVEAPKEAPTQE